MSAVGQTLSINDEYKRRRAFAANRLVSRPPVRICAKPSLAAGKPRKLWLSYPDIAEYIELREYGMNVRRKSRLLCTESRRETAPSLPRPRSGRVVSGGRTTHFARRPPRPRGGCSVEIMFTFALGIPAAGAPC